MADRIENRKKTVDKRQMLLVTLCWAIYTASYLGKYCYSANISVIRSYFAVDKAAAGLVGTCFFFAYGAGQVINGIFCKKYHVYFVVLGALLVSACCNAIMAFCDNFAIFKYVWFINGATLSVLWPTLIRLLSENLSDDYCPKAVVVMGTSVAVGTFVTYGISALFNAVINNSSSYKYAFYVAIVALPMLAVLWATSYRKLVVKTDKSAAGTSAVGMQDLGNEKKKTSGALLMTIIVLALFAVVTNLVKDGLTTWIPQILSDIYAMPDFLSILLTLLLPVLALFGTALAVAMNKKIKDIVNLCALAFAVITVLIAIVIAAVNTGAAIMLICLSLVSLMTSAVNNAVTSMFPLYYKEQLNSGLVAGVLNGFCYIGSTISSYGLGALADGVGWNAVFELLASASAFCVVLAAIRILVANIKKKKNKL